MTLNAQEKRPQENYQESISNAFKNISSIKEGGTKYKRVTDDILFMICKDYEPLSMVEREGFRTFVNNNIPQFDMPCPATMKSYFKEKYEKTSLKYKEIIKRADNVTLMTDIRSVHRVRNPYKENYCNSDRQRSQYCISSIFVRWQRMSSVVLCTYPKSGCHQFDRSHRRAG